MTATPDAPVESWHARLAQLGIRLPATAPGAPARRAVPGGGLASWTMSEQARRAWEYATIPLLIHNTKAILDSWGVDVWELVTVFPGPTGADQLVAYLKRPA